MKNILLVIIPALLLLGACGGPANQPQPGTAALPASGEDVYKKTCIACHQANGDGVPGSFPPLAKSDFLVNREAVIKQVIKGSSGEITVNGKTYNNVMPPQPLSDAEIASVLTYVYYNFGNNGNTVTVDEVKAVRAKL